MECGVFRGNCRDKGAVKGAVIAAPRGNLRGATRRTTDGAGILGPAPLVYPLFYRQGSPNRDRLVRTARLLRPLLGEFVFVGGQVGKILRA